MKNQKNMYVLNVKICYTEVSSYCCFLEGKMTKTFLSPKYAVTNDISPPEAILHSHKNHWPHQWCGNRSQNYLKVVSVIFTKRYIRQYWKTKQNKTLCSSQCTKQASSPFAAQSQVTFEGKKTAREQFLELSTLTMDSYCDEKTIIANTDKLGKIKSWKCWQLNK